MSIFAQHIAGGGDGIDAKTQKELLARAVAEYCSIPPKKILILPPDHTRLYSGAGALTNFAWELFGQQAQIDIMPALGTHSPMTREQITMMFGDSIPAERFRTHDWKQDLIKLGTVPAEEIEKWSEGKLSFDVAAEINRCVLEDGYDLILSIGQVVPHEVVGMANYTKNLFVGIGGADTINKSHYLGAVYNAERVMGRIETPPRKLFNYCYHHFLKGKVPILFVLTVMQALPGDVHPQMRGLFMGDDDDVFVAAARLSQKLNINYVESPQKRVVCYLTPDEFKSTWLGNKAVYRTRMMIADEGELIVLAPGVKEFGEDPKNDEIIRRYGYRHTDEIIRLVQQTPELQQNLGAAAHLIHGTSDGRFRIIYATNPELMPPETIRSVGYEWAPIDAMMERYYDSTLTDGPQTDKQGEAFYYINNPALGLWALSGSL
ncbi:MAG: DUF2088 domain-containing protein [Lentisphaerae bacterium]|nr:MAG: DUF2088 domain-containing protein [Lentisphaerota bacterium]